MVRIKEVTPYTPIINSGNSGFNKALNFVNQAMRARAFGPLTGRNQEQFYYCLYKL